LDHTAILNDFKQSSSMIFFLYLKAEENVQEFLKKSQFFKILDQNEIFTDCSNISAILVLSFFFQKMAMGDKVFFRNRQLMRPCRIKYDHPKYLGVTLDRSLTYNTHLTKTGQKVAARINTVRKLAGTNWGSSADTLRTASLALVSMVE
jgi:hypothetical protein